MADLGEIVVHLRADMKDMARGLKSAGTALKRFGAKVVGVMASAGRAIARFVKNAALKLGRFAKRTLKYATIALIGLGTAAVKMAMDAEESENLFKESMEGMAGAARKWSEEISKALGLNSFNVRRQVATFNVMFDSMGFGAEKAFEMSKGLTQLAFDMASFYNLSNDVAFEKIRSGIVGMSRPLQNLGILIQEQDIKTWALTNGMIKQGEEMTQQQKVMARYGAIMDQTTKSQGDLERTLDSTTNIVRTLWSQIKLLGIEIGMVLKPYVDEVAMAMRDWLVGHRDDVTVYVRVMIVRLKEIVAFMRNDWVAGIKLSLQAALIVFKGFGESIYLVMKAAFLRVGGDIGEWVKSIPGAIADAVGKADTARTITSLSPVGAAINLYRLKQKLKDAQAGSDFVGPPAPRKTLTAQLKEVGLQTGAAIKKLYQEADVFDMKSSNEFIATMQQANEWLGKMPDAMADVGEGLKGMAGAAGNLADETSDATFDIAAAYRSMYGQMGRMTDKSYKHQLTVLDDLKKKYKEHGMDRLAVDAWYIEQVRELDIERLKSSQSVVSGFKAAGMQLKNDLKTWGEVGFGVAMSMSDSMSTAFDSIIEGTKSVGEAFEQLGMDITRAITRAVTDMLAQFVVMKAFTGVGFAGFGATGGGEAPPAFSSPHGGPAAGSAHRGGTIGTLQVEPMQPGLFRNAPRLHGGLEDDEFATILQRGETVLKKGDGGGPKVVVNIENQTGGQIEAEQTEVEFDGESMIVGIVVKNYNEGGAIRNMVRSGV